MQALTAEGFEVEVFEPQRRGKQMLEDYSRIRTSADAILDFEVGIPFLDDLIAQGGGFLPSVTVDVQMIKVGGRRPVIFRQAYAYENREPDSLRFIMAPVDQTCRFESIKAAYDDQAHLGECLRAAAPKIARLVADVLKP